MCLDLSKLCIGFQADLLLLQQVVHGELVYQRLIGEGSFGKVWLAKWRETLVAVKVLSQPLQTADEDQRQWQRMLQAMEKVCFASAMPVCMGVQACCCQDCSASPCRRQMRTSASGSACCRPWSRCAVHASLLERLTLLPHLLSMA